jgi:YbbR domain-containing protein
MAWRDLIYHNLGWKIVSLVLATVVWLTFQSDAGKKFGFAQSLTLMAPSREFIRHQVNVITSNSDTRRFKIEPSAVDITVRGERTALQNLSPKEIQAVVDVTRLPDATESSAKVDVYVPSGLTVVQVLPSDVRVVPLQP